MAANELKEESWTRNAYFRCATNLCSFIVKKIDEETENADKAISDLEWRLQKDRREFERKLRVKVSRNDVSAIEAQVSRQNNLEEEATHRKEELHLIYSQFPLANLDEKTECNLRISLRPTLLESLGRFDVNPKATMEQEGGAQRYLVPTEYKKREKSCPSTSSQERDLQRELDLAIFEECHSKRCDERTMEVARSRLEYTRTQLAAERERNEEGERTKCYEEEIQYLERECRALETAQHTRALAAKKSITQLKKLFNRHTNSSSSGIELPSSQSVARKKQYIQQLVRHVRGTLLSEQECQSGHAASVPHLTSHFALSPQRSPTEKEELFSRRQCETVDLPAELSAEQEAEIQQYLWPHVMEQRISCVLAGSVIPPALSGENSQEGQSRKRGSAASSKRLPDAVANAWLSIRGIGEFVASRGILQYE